MEHVFGIADATEEMIQVFESFMDSRVFRECFQPVDIDVTYLIIHEIRFGLRKKSVSMDAFVKSGSPDRRNPLRLLMSTCYLQQSCDVDEEYVLKVGMTFESVDEAGLFYKKYAKRAGFSTKIRNTNRCKETKEAKNQLITCNREGRWTSEVPSV
ncbi:hypothetical protein PIB30_066718 [Stylosanthes scabra]|uniref:FAR1 domain-containing protein n=1 Tax=Stylosanthes scabra TaxID=79078 RepID=A0ABU6YLT1_9FABA|nr:hypothetical protein [Stylosanthes scabra]